MSHHFLLTFLEKNIYIGRKIEILDINCPFITSPFHHETLYFFPFLLRCCFSFCLVWFLLCLWKAVIIGTKQKLPFSTKPLHHSALQMQLNVIFCLPAPHLLLVHGQIYFDWIKCTQRGAPWDTATGPALITSAQDRNSFHRKSIPHQITYLFVTIFLAEELMSWQMPAGLTIKDLSLVIISAIGYEGEEILSFIFNDNSIL